MDGLVYVGFVSVVYSYDTYIYVIRALFGMPYNTLGRRLLSIHCALCSVQISVMYA